MKNKIFNDAEKLLASEMKRVKGGRALAGCTCKKSCQLCVSGFATG